jgi:hypothetical protein
LTSRDTPPALFALDILKTGPYFLPQPVWTEILPFRLLAVIGKICVCCHTQFFQLKWGVKNFFLGLQCKLYPSNVSLPPPHSSSQKPTLFFDIYKAVEFKN